VFLYIILTLNSLFLTTFFISSRPILFYLFNKKGTLLEIKIMKIVYNKPCSFNCLKERINIDSTNLENTLNKLIQRKAFGEK